MTDFILHDIFSAMELGGDVKGSSRKAKIKKREVVSLMFKIAIA